MGQFNIYDSNAQQQIYFFSFQKIIPQLQGAKINEFFDIVRPIIEFKFEIILTRANNIFELQTTENIDVLLKVLIF